MNESVLHSANHPDKRTLAEYLQGKLAPNRFQQVDDHLSKCESCQTLLLESGDRIVDDKLTKALKSVGSECWTASISNLSFLHRLSRR